MTENFAYGFITLQEDTKVLCQMLEFFNPECAAGVRWNDREFSIQWPVSVKVISESDQNYKDFKQ